MLDLDAIAGRRAESLRQERRDWLDAVWSQDFQSLSARLTDGEVMELLGLCASAGELTAVTTKLSVAPARPDHTPFDWLRAEAADQNLSLVEYVRRAAGERS